MSKPKRRKMLSALESMRMYEKTLIFAMNAKEHRSVLNELLSTLQEDSYCTQAELVLSEDGTQAKMHLRGNILQMNNLDGLLRYVPELKNPSEDPNAEKVSLIKYYHGHFWNELSCPNAEMHLSVFVGGLAMRQALLDCPDFHPQPNLWKLGEQCYQAMEESQLFTGLSAHHTMILFSFVAGYLGEQGSCELAFDGGDGREIAKLKGEALVAEEQGWAPALVHAFAEQLRDRLQALGMQSLMQVLKTFGADHC